MREGGWSQSPEWIPSNEIRICQERREEPRVGQQKG